MLTAHERKPQPTMIGKVRDNATSENAEDRLLRFEKVAPFSNGYKSLVVIKSPIIRVLELNFNAVSSGKTG